MAIRKLVSHSSGTASSGVLTRAFSLIDALAKDAPASLTTLSRLTQLPTSSALRLLRSLEGLGMVAKDVNGTYRLGRRLVEVGLLALDGVVPIELTRPHLRAMANDSGESANCAIRVEDAAVYVDQVPSDRAIRHMSWIGRRVPLHGTAIGAALRFELNGDGFSYTRETVEPDVTAIAAPVVGRSGVVICALSVTGPSYRITDSRIRELGASVASTALVLSEALSAISSPERFESLVTVAGAIQYSA